MAEMWKAAWVEARSMACEKRTETAWFRATSAVPLAGRMRTTAGRAGTLRSTVTPAASGAPSVSRRSEARLRW